jgi:hypothetical protein
VVSVGLGVGAVIYLMIALGFCGLWYSPVAYGLLITLTLLGFADIKSLIMQIATWIKSRTTSPLSKFGVVVGLILLGHVVFNLIGVLAPPINGDTLGLYLVWPKLWVQHHGIYELNNYCYSFMPSNAQMLSSFGLLLKNDILSELLTGFLMSVLGCMAVYSIVRKRFSKDTSLLAATLFYCTPLIVWLSYSAKVDLMMAFFELLAFYAFLNFYFEDDERQSVKWLLLSAVFCGLAAGTKVLALALVIIGLGAVTCCIKRGYIRKNIRRNIKYAIWFVLVVAVVASPWYIRNIISKGNPIYPFLSEARSVSSLYIKRSEGAGLLGYLGTLWSFSFHNPHMGVNIGPVFIFSVPCLLFIRKIDRCIKLLLILVFAYSLLCYMTVARPRHILAGIGLLSIIAGYAITRMRDMRRTLKYGVTGVLIAMLLFNLSLGLWRNLIITQNVPYILGSINRQEFLSRALTKNYSVPYPMMRFINDELPNNTVILTIGPFYPYYIDRTTLGGWDCVFLKNEGQIEPYLAKKAAGYIFVNPVLNLKGENINSEYISAELSESDYLSIFRKAFNNSPLFSDNYAGRHLKLLFSFGGKYLFEWIPASQN